MKKIELLAPAGSMQSLYAAVQAGADAVYMGGSKFSARAYASNFDEERMIQAVDYCHLYGVKVYITINTLIKEDEIAEALEYAAFLYKIGVDAVIIQDTGLAYLIRSNFPDFELHASTQMTVHNGEGAMLLKESGFKRIVLSRELSLEEINHISRDLGVETEIFIHGALCICYSGQCLMSSMIGGRSGNRGRCAQPCRLPYTLVEKLTQKQKQAYILSPKDICTLEDVRNIIETSTSSLKIEGRMKRPEYVAGVVDIYRRAIDSVYNNSSFDFKSETRKLMQLFNREGFSKAYLMGNKGKDMMAYNFPKNTGVVVGKAGKDLIIELDDQVSLGDGIRIGEDGFVVSKIFKSGKEVVEGYQGEKVKLLPSKYKEGDILYKTSDTKLLKSLEYYYKNLYDRKIELPLSLEFEVGSPINLKTTYHSKEFVFQGDEVQAALKKPLDVERLKEAISKSGDTPFKFDNIELLHYEEGFLPVSSLNSARRELLAKVERHIIDSSRRDFDKQLNYNGSEKKLEPIPEAFITVNSIEQVKAFKDSLINGALVVDIFKRQNNLNIEEVKKLNIENLYIKAPNIIKNEFETICSMIEKQLPNINGIVTGNLGIIKRFKDKIKIIGDYKLNVFNSFSLSFYEKFLEGTAVSVELNKKELGQTLKNKSLTVQVKLYGKEELMVSEYCPIGSVFGGKSGSSSCCENCGVGCYTLIDRKNEKFILKTDKFCRSYIYNSVATNLIPHLEEIKKLGADSFRLDFVDEGYDDTLEILKSYKEGKWQGEYINFTRGHYKRGVE